MELKSERPAAQSPAEAGLRRAADPTDGWLTPGRFALLLGALVVAAFPGVLLGGHSFIIRDFGLFSYPVAHFQRECFWRGELPLWNPYNDCGIPFLAQWNTMALYPPALIYLLLPLQWSLSFFCLAHLYWGGLGMYFLASRWTQHRLAAALAGVIFAFNGLSLTFLMWPSHIATFSWFPWLLWLAPLAWNRGGRALVWAILAGALQMLAGGPETILLTWLVLFLLAAADWFRRAAPRKLICLRFFGMAFLVALLCAAQLLPFLQLVTHSQRDSSFGSSDWSMPAWGWANLLVPLFRCFPSPQGVFFQQNQYWTNSYYAGIGSVLLWAVAVRRVRAWRVRFVAGLLLLALVLALGDNGLVYRVLRLCLPGLGFVRYPVKCVILALALAPLLAAFGLAALSRESGRFGRFEWLALALLLALVGGITVLGWKFPVNEVRAAPALNGLSRALFLLIICFVMRAVLSSPGRRRVLFGCLLLVVFWLDLVTHMPRQNPSARPLVYAPAFTAAFRDWTPPPSLGQSRALLAPAAEEALRKHVIPDLEQNYLVSRLALLADCNLLEDVPMACGFFSLAPEAINNVVVLPYMRTNQDYRVMLDFMGVSQITAPGEIFKWAPRPSAMPLVTAGQRALIVPDDTAYDALAQTNTDLRRIVLLPPEAAAFVSATQRVAARVLSAQFANEKVSIQTEAPAPAMVVVSQTWYPAWQARIDGQPARLWRANYAFQALQVPAGHHAIELAYKDKALALGALLSSLGVAACLLLLWRVARRRNTDDGTS